MNTYVGGRGRWVRGLGRTAAALALLAAAAPAPAQVSLGTVVDLAQRNCGAVKLAEADASKAKAILAETGDVYIPNLVIGSSIGPPSIGFPAGQPSIANASMQSLAFSFSQLYYLKAARMAYKAASLALKDAREQVALDASTAYIELDAIVREKDAAREQAEFAARLGQIEQERTDAGVDSRSDLLQTRLTVAELKLKLLHLDTRAATLASQVAALTGLPVASIQPDHASIPAVPAVSGETILTAGIESGQANALSRQLSAKGDTKTTWRPQIGFGAQYSRDSTALNNYSTYYKHFKADNFSIGLTIQVPLFDRTHRDKARETAADALRATVEAEQAQRQNDVQIATLNASLRELDSLAEISSLKQEISAEQLKAVQSQLELGNGAGVEPGAPPQLTPKAEQLARIDERQKYVEVLDSEFELNKARLGLLRALGHMEDWLRTLKSSPSSTMTTSK